METRQYTVWTVLGILFMEGTDVIIYKTPHLVCESNHSTQKVEY